MAKVLFIQKDWFENVGVMQLSSVLKLNGHECELLFFEGNRRLLNEVNRTRQDIIAFSIMTIESSFALETASFLKQQGVDALVIVGGTHPTFFPDFINNDCIDIVNIGEGEYSLLDLADAVDQRADITGIQNFIVKKDGRTYKNPVRPLVDLDELPLPDREIYFKYDYFKIYGVYSFVLSRGCPYRCNYCFNHTWNEMYRETDNFRSVRQQSIERCMEEIDLVSKKADITSISFNDSTFNLNREWALSFLREYGKAFSFPFSLNLRPGLIDEEFVKELALTGSCFLVRLGIEVGNEDFRRKVLKKNIKNKQILESVELLKKYGIKICTYNMYGLPGETLEDALQTIELNQRIRPYVSTAMIFYPLPGVNITKYSIEMNYIKHSDLFDTNTMKMIPFESVLKQPEINSVMNLAKLSYFAIYFPFLTPIIKRLVHLPPNRLFDLLSFIDLAVQSMKLYKVDFSAVMRGLFKYLSARFRAI